MSEYNYFSDRHDRKIKKLRFVNEDTKPLNHKNTELNSFLISLGLFCVVVVVVWMML